VVDADKPPLRIFFGTGPLEIIKDEDVFLIHDFLSPQECDHFIARSESVGFDEAPITTAAGPVMRKGIRDNSRAMIDDSELAELESYGLLNPTVQTKDRVLFDEDALAIARLAAGFFRRGVGARHLRMYRSFAEREAVLFEQVLLGYLRQRNPDARARAQEQLEELARLGRGLRGAYLRRAVRDAFTE